MNDDLEIELRVIRAERDRYAAALDQIRLGAINKKTPMYAVRIANEALGYPNPKASK